MVFPNPTSSASIAPRERGGTESKQGCVNLMGVQIDLSICKGCRKLFQAIRGAALGQLMGIVFGVVVGDLHYGWGVSSQS